MTGVNPSALEKLPVLTEKKKKIDLHTNLAHTLLYLIKRRHLDEFYAVEDALRENNSGTNLDKSVLMSCLTDASKGTPEDKMRLFLTLYLCNCSCVANGNEFVLSKAELDEVESVIKQFALGDSSANDLGANSRSSSSNNNNNNNNNGLSTLQATSQSKDSVVDALAYFKSIQSLLIRMSRQQANAPSKSTSSLSKLTEKFVSKSKTILGEQVKLLSLGGLASDGEKVSQLTTTKIVNSIMLQKPIPETESFYTLDPKMVR